MVLLSVLDQSPVRTGSTPAEAIQETIRLAEAVDRLGYHRYWLAEHHSSAALAGPSPEILIGQVAARTSRLRVGSGGVMLSHYSALKVAENFRLLEALYPGRIDLGIGRAPGSDRLTAMALAHGPGALGIEQFPNRVADLLRFVHDEVEPEHPFAPVHAMPTGPTAPEVWLLGSSDESAAYAAHFGTGFSFAHFIIPRGGAPVVRAYQSAFRPSAYLAEPRASVGVFVVCADTEAEALRLAKSRVLWVIRVDSNGERLPYPTVAEAEAHVYTPRELVIAEHNRDRTIAGAPEQVRDRLLALGAEYGVDEFLVLTITEDYASRLRSYELLAQVFGIS
jgi:luciferase family oxidoreductase group 1